MAQLTQTTLAERPNPPMSGNEPSPIDLESGYRLGNPDLPIHLKRPEIVASARENSVTILVTPTGTGKSTQVVQFALEMRGEDETPLFDEIIATQTRIVAARTVSERVGGEIECAGESASVAYYTSMEGTPAPQWEQDIVYLTDGKAEAQILHRDKKRDPNKKRLLIIDEVHEWNEHIEMLIAIAAEQTDPASPRYDKNLTVIIMSATMDSKGLQEHFGHTTAPIIEVDVPTPHEVTRSIRTESPAIVALEIARRTRGKVLVFSPGKPEIRRLAERVRRLQADNAGSKIPVIPLHGQQTASQQARAFEEYPQGAIVGTTEVAETSITVPDAAAVVDTGEVRVSNIEYDLVATGSETLRLENAPQASLIQRLGRVGRTGPGEYVLCSPNGETPPLPFEDRPAYRDPAIWRTRLDSLVLRVKATGREIGDFRFFHKPTVEAVAAAKTRLVVMGALGENGMMTRRGRLMEKLPLDPEYACMVAFACEKGYSEEVVQHVLDIVAIMQRGGILKRAPKEDRWRQLLEKDQHGTVIEQDSDFLAQLEVYRKIMDMDPLDWEKYDIIEHSAGLVEQVRASLARQLHLTIGEPTAVAPENRQAVLACINAGQLNQLWHRNGSTWSLAIEKSLEFSLSDASVVGALGHLATGTLFSLGTPETVRQRIQDVNRIPNLETLEQSARHLLTDEIDYDNVTYDPETGQFYALVQRKLGRLVLRSFQRTIELEPGSPEMEKARRGYAKYTWEHWPEKGDTREVYTLDTIDEVLINPQSTQYGTDPFTGEPLLAWRGGAGWCLSKEVAMISLRACKDRLERAPIDQGLSEIKKEIKRAGRALIKLSGLNRRSTDPIHILIHAFTEGRANATDWLDEARELLGQRDIIVPVVDQTIKEVESTAERLGIIRDKDDLKSIRYDENTQQFIVRVERKIGKAQVILRAYERTVRAEIGNPESDKLHSEYIQNIWNIWTRHNTSKTASSLKDPDQQTTEIITTQYATDPVTGEPLLAFMGRNGKWYPSQLEAANSFVQRARLERSQRREPRMLPKETVDELMGILLKLSRLIQDPREAINARLFRTLPKHRGWGKNARAFIKKYEHLLTEEQPSLSSMV